MTKVVQFEDGALYRRRGGTMRFVHWPGSGSETVAIHYLELKPGEEFAEHSHEESVDVITLIQGSGEIVSGGTVYEVEAGQSILVPPKTLHSARNTGEETFISIDVLVPPDPVMYAELAAEAVEDP
ncbi:MAG: cupin domain-containing protein [Actinomycetia bacterium]|nr:cupin domain-containing protein [Actinomycetes bacterium]